MKYTLSILVLTALMGPLAYFGLTTNKPVNYDLLAGSSPRSTLKLNGPMPIPTPSAVALVTKIDSKLPLATVARRVF